jgi:SAM-dependent methyltransferase
MYEQLAEIYDLINAGIPYEREYKLLQSLVDISDDKSLLDVGCGTGEHIHFFPESYDIFGLDYSKGMLDIARAKNPHINFMHGDMRDFELGRKFGVVSCLGSALQYNLTLEDLERSIKNLLEHANDYVIFDVRYCIDKWIDGYVKDKTYENDSIIVRESWVSNRVDEVYSVWEPKFEVKSKLTGESFEYMDYHKIRLFSIQEIHDILTRLGYSYRLIDVLCGPVSDVKQTQFYFLIKK